MNIYEKVLINSLEPRRYDRRLHDLLQTGLFVKTGSYFLNLIMEQLPWCQVDLNNIFFEHILGTKIYPDAVAVGIHSIFAYCSLLVSYCRKFILILLLDYELL